MLDKRGASWKFIPTDAEGQHANLVAGILTLLFTSVSIVVVLLFAYVWHRRDLRHHLRHTSTQLLYACVLVTIPQGLGFASTCLNIGRREPSFCRLGMTLSVFGYNAANCLQCCICINLVIAIKWARVVRHDVVRWYYAVSIFISAVLAIVPLCAGQYQWSATNHSCWLKDTEATYNTWQLACLEAPLVVVTVLMALSTAEVSKYVYKSRAEGQGHAAVVNQLFEPTFNTGLEELNIQSDTNMNDRFEIEEIVVSEQFHPSLNPSPKKSPKVSKILNSPRQIFGKYSPGVPPPSTPVSSASPTRSPNMPDSMAASDTPDLAADTEENSTTKVRVARMPLSVHFGRNPSDQDARKLRGLLLRIALFPFMHVVISISGVLGSIILSYSEHSGRSTQNSLYMLTFIGTAWIPLAYSMCALLADTSLWDAFRHMRSKSKDVEDESFEVALGRNKHRLSQGTAQETVQIRHHSDTLKHIRSWSYFEATDSWLTSSLDGTSEVDLEMDSASSDFVPDIVLTRPRASVHSRLEQVVEEDEEAEAEAHGDLTREEVKTIREETRGKGRADEDARSR